VTKNFAHRGFSGRYPENTRIAFEMATQVPGCDGIENDVQMTKDGELVIMHDEKLDRTCRNLKGYLKDYTLAELRQGDITYKFTGKVPDQHIITLHEYLEIVEPTDLFSNIELKTGIFPYEGIELKVYEELRYFGLLDRTMISSFNHYSCKRFKEICPEMECGLLTESWILNAGKYVSENGIENYHPVFAELTKEKVDEIHSYGVGINTWTVNREEDIRRLISYGVESVIGNYPDKVTRIREEMGQ